MSGPENRGRARQSARARDKASAGHESGANRGTRTTGHLGRGGLAAFLLHLHLLAPFLIATFIYAGREEAQRAEEMDVGFETVPPEELPRDLPPLDDTPPPQAKAPRQKTKPDRRDQERPRADRKHPEEKPKPEEKVARQTPAEPAKVAPPPPAVPQPPTPQVPKAHEKVVDLDNDKDVEPPPDAKYLAQKNNRVDQETRATQTNLDREQKGAEGSQQPPGQQRDDDKEVGDEKQKIAQLDDQKSKLGRSAPEVTPQKEATAPERPDQEQRPMPSPVLSMRDTAPRGHEVTPETVDPSLPHDPAGMLARATPRGAFRDDEADHMHRGDKKMKLALSGKDYEYLFGKEAQAERQLAEKERSTRVGKFARNTARVRSALENFIPEVRAGNQTALNTRAAPFAAFIARMHRSIHQLWGFGALENWDELPSSSPLNDESLMNVLEIVLNRDGTVSKVTVVRPSKYLPYDAAAIDVVYSAGPYPEPPREIRSGNGKIYVHWSFFRDGRQCATSGVDYFILNNAPAGGDLQGADDRPVVPAGEPPPGPRRLERNLAEAPRALPVRSFSAPRPPAAREEAVSGGAAGEAPHADDKAAGDLARAWFAAYVRGDVPAMIQKVTFPFRSTAGVVAKTPAALSQMLRSLIAETPSRPTGPVAIETAAGLRKLVGKLPAGLDDGTGSLFAVSQIDGDVLILLLTRTGHGWKGAGLVRR